ncbi:MAG: hypothetical protein LLG44_03205, partial [Chloroflexi bacterium]|nr:hypothetical protein [Chloroflexota bacterium]
AAYGGETVVLENAHIRLEVHKRVTGWGWGELFLPGPSGKPERLYAVIEHLAEAWVEGQPYPMRLEAKEYTLAESPEGKQLTFAVKMQEVEPPDSAYNGISPLTGTITLSLAADDALIRYTMELEPQFQIRLRRIRGLWLRMGADSFGAAKDDAIFPGIEWLLGKEWSSGTDWFEHPQALRMAPHPHKVAFPLMAVSYGGFGIGLAWDNSSQAMSDAVRLRCPQPVFAVPNFIDRRDQSLLGIMWPSARWGMSENALAAEPAIKVRKGLKLELKAEISAVKGKSLDVVCDWVRRHGMPEPGKPRYEWYDALNRIARAYNSNLWIEGQGWGFRGTGSPVVPEFVSWYAEHGSEVATAEGLRAKIAWVKAQKLEPQPKRDPLSQPHSLILAKPEQAREIAEALLALQTPEGDFPFDPQGRHHTNLIDWAAFWRPLGQPGDSCLDLVTAPAMALLIAADKFKEPQYLAAARKALDLGMKWDRPEGGDWWETPLYSPNLLAAGNAAIAYCLGFRATGDERYRARAIHFIRSLLPFTHLWQPPDIEMMYNTKPCLNSTCWYLSDWVSKHVEWEVLRVFHQSKMMDIDWATIDPGIDWVTYQRGVTTAVQRWMVDHKDPAWLFSAEFSQDLISGGAWDTLFADTFDPVHNCYGGGPIMPELIGENVRIVLENMQR